MASALAEELNTAVMIMNITANATPVNPNPRDERFIVVSFDSQIFARIDENKVMTRIPYY